MKTIFALILLLCLSCACWSDDLALSDALVTSGIAFAAKGRTAQAEETLWRALVYNDANARAYIELGKLAEKRGDKAQACDLYVKAVTGLEEKERRECDQRLRFLSPERARFVAYISDFSTSLDRIEPSLGVLAMERASEIRDGLNLQRKIATVVAKPKSALVGLWKKSDGTTLALNEDHSINFSADASGGEWKLDGESSFSVKFGWGVTVKCSLVNHDLFLENGRTKWTRSE